MRSMKAITQASEYYTPVMEDLRHAGADGWVRYSITPQGEQHLQVWVKNTDPTSYHTYVVRSTYRLQDGNDANLKSLYTMREMGFLMKGPGPEANSWDFWIGKTKEVDEPTTEEEDNPTTVLDAVQQKAEYYNPMLLALRKAGEHCFLRYVPKSGITLYRRDKRSALMLFSKLQTWEPTEYNADALWYLMQMGYLLNARAELLDLSAGFDFWINPDITAKEWAVVDPESLPDAPDWTHQEIDAYAKGVSEDYKRYGETAGLARDPRLRKLQEDYKRKDLRDSQPALKPEGPPLQHQKEGVVANPDWISGGKEMQQYWKGYDKGYDDALYRVKQRLLNLFPS